MGEEKEDPVKLHKDGNTLYELGKYKEAMENFLRASELYRKANNFFDGAVMLFKAGECAYMLKDYETAVDYFLKSADLSFKKGCLLYTSPSPRDVEESRMPSSA